MGQRQVAIIECDGPTCSTEPQMGIPQDWFIVHTLNISYKTTEINRTRSKPDFYFCTLQCFHNMLADKLSEVD